MKRLIFPLLFAVTILIYGCVSNNPASKQEEKSRSKVEAVVAAQQHNETAKMEQIGSLAYGTDYALSKVTNPPRAVVVAKDMNQRIVSLAGTPTLEKMKEMQATIDKLTSEIELTRRQGEEALAKKDLEIQIIQDETKILMNAKDAQMAEYMDKARIAAANSDAYKAELAEYEGWFGLKAIGKGLWHLAKSATWLLLGIGILFLVLRMAASANPVCGAVFGIFEQMVSWGINAIKVFFPKAISMAGHVTKEAYDAGQMLLRKLVDSIQIIKDMERRTGKDATLKDVLVELEKTMNDNEKQQIEKVKRELGY